MRDVCEKDIFDFLYLVDAGKKCCFDNIWMQNPTKNMENLKILVDPELWRFLLCWWFPTLLQNQGNQKGQSLLIFCLQVCFDDEEQVVVVVEGAGDSGSLKG